jgi:hypothetical protein
VEVAAVGVARVEMALVVGLAWVEVAAGVVGIVEIARMVATVTILVGPVRCATYSITIHECTTQGLGSWWKHWSTRRLTAQ